MTAPDPKPRSTADIVNEAFRLSQRIAPDGIIVDHGCIACGTPRPVLYRCIPCSDEEAMSTATVARGLAIDEARRAVALRVHLVGELDARIVEDCVAAIDALRGAR